MKACRQHLLLTVVGLALVPFARPAIAVTKTPVIFTISSITTVSPGTEWVSRNTFHLRDELDTGAVTGDLTGTITIVLNSDLNVANPAIGFTGIQIRATFAITTATVTWVGRVTDSGPLGRGINLVEADGTDGSKLLGRVFGQADGTFLVQGAIIAH
jgi:hypothetical protein